MAEGGVPGIRAKMRRLHIPDVEEGENCYRMDRPRMGHALIINNVEFEFPGSRIDVQVLVEAFTKIGFDVDCKYNCSWQEMVKLKKWIMNETNHIDSNCFVLVVISHGNEQGYVTDKSKINNAWRVEDFVKELSVVETLLGRPKVMIVNACRGENFNSGNALPKGALSHLANPDVESLAYLPDKSDMFLTFPTVPGYIAYAGDASGSPYLQALATYLERHYMKKDLASIHEDVTRYVSTIKQGEDQVMHCPEFRSTLRYKLRFSEFKISSESASSSEAAPAPTTTTKSNTSATAAPSTTMTTATATPPTSPTSVTAPTVRTVVATTTVSAPATKAATAATAHATKPTVTGAKTSTTGAVMKPSTAATGPTLAKSPKAFHRVRMDLISTHDTGLQAWGRTKFTVMPTTGDVIIWGKVSIDPVSRMINILMRGKRTQAAFHIYSNTSTGWKKQTELKALCEHYRVYLLPVKVNHRELLAVSCIYCEVIRLLNVASGDVSEAFHNPRYRPGHMCAGEGDVMYVVHHVEGLPVLELNIAQSPFTGPSDILQSGMEKYYSLCYIPPPLSLIVIGDHSPSIIRAVRADSSDRADSSECAWEVRPRVDGVECYPHGLLFSPCHQVLLVADGNNRRVLVLHPRDGSHLQTIQLQQLGSISELSLLQNQLVVHHNDGNNQKCSYFSMN